MRARIGMAYKIEYLADHTDAIPDLARAHQAEWTAITPHVTVSDRAERFQARAGAAVVTSGVDMSGKVPGAR